MKPHYLELTFRHGAVLAAYFYLPREGDARSARCERFDPGLVVDFDREGRAIGIEITSPERVTLDRFNRLLEQLGQSAVEERDLRPLRAVA
jgi:hypothetical protein